MNALFIYSVNDAQSLSIPLRNLEWIQFGISYISAVLKKEGHNTKLVILSRSFGEKNYIVVDEQIKRARPDLVCFTAVSSEFDFISKIAQYIKVRNPGIYSIIGGPHASLNPTEIPFGIFDALCIGEGEYPVLELITQLQQKKQPVNIPNLWIKNGDSIQKNPPRPFLQNLDDLPFPDWRIWEQWVEALPALRFSVLLGRGCPYECTYCSNHAFKKIAPGIYTRFRSVGSIISEITTLVKEYPQTKNIYLEVETIGINQQWAKELCLSLKKINLALAYPISFGTNIRIAPGIDYEELFSCFQRSNFRFINIGLESGSEIIRRDVLKRYYSNQDVINVTQIAKKHNLLVNFYNLIGIPDETLSNFRETLELNRVCMPDALINYIFYPYPGTDLYRACKEKGLLSEAFLDTKIERRTPVLNLDGFKKCQILKHYLLFYYYVYKGYKPLIWILRYILTTFISLSPFLSKLRSYKYIIFKRPKSIAYIRQQGLFCNTFN